MRIGIASGDRLTVRRSLDGKPHWGGAGWVRLGQFEQPLLAKGFDINLGILTWLDNRFVIDISEGQQVYVDVDIVYLQRLMHKGLAEHIKMARANGQVVINDLDDWYWGLHPSNGAFLSSHPKHSPNENINHYRGVLSASDLVTVSTQYLADRISRFVSCPIEVIPNTVDVARFTTKEHTDSDRPVVGWVGSTGHRSGDLEEMRGILRPMYEDGEILLQHSGHHEGGRHVAEAWSVTPESVITVPACDPEDYPSLLTMDVGIAPLNDTPFNHAKSEIKLLEYSAAGIPWIGSALTSYSALQNDWGAGRTAKKAMHWIKHLRALRDPKVRKEEGEILRDKVWSRDIATGTDRLIELFDGLWSSSS